MGQVKGPKIYAVIVLYRRSADQSEAFVSLRTLLEAECGRNLELLIYDNSPYEQLTPQNFDGEYLRDPINSGLAKGYNEALVRAEQRKTTWLMLLDQDTVVTHQYLREVLECAGTLENEQHIVAMVPKLQDGNLICSPIYPPRYGPAQPVDKEIYGPAKTALHVLNSGAVLRVTAVRRIGGFPSDFPLDYLDHATFFQLQRGGGRVFLLRARLPHKLSSNSEPGKDADSVRRVESMLNAEAQFYARYGTSSERLLRRLRLLRAILGRVVRGKGARHSWRMLKAAIRL